MDPPDTAQRARPPKTALIRAYTVWSYSACCIRSPAPGPVPSPCRSRSTASAYRTATDTARSNTAALPPSSARRRACRKIRSKTWGTAITQLGRKLASDGSSAPGLMSG